jgi:hypothetical protein
VQAKRLKEECHLHVDGKAHPVCKQRLRLPLTIERFEREIARNDHADNGDGQAREGALDQGEHVRDGCKCAVNLGDGQRAAPCSSAFRLLISAMTHCEWISEGKIRFSEFICWAAGA